MITVAELQAKLLRLQPDGEVRFAPVREVDEQGSQRLGEPELLWSPEGDPYYCLSLDNA